eukprot:458500-Prymnesium_polylepis.1
MGSYVTERCKAIQALTLLGGGKGASSGAALPAGWAGAYAAGAALTLVRCLADASVPVRLE